MPNRIRAVVLAVALLAGLAGGQAEAWEDPAPGYHDNNVAHCISKGEIVAYQHSKDYQTRETWEHRWEVVDRGWVDPQGSATYNWQYALAYKTCGYPVSEQIAFLFYQKSTDELVWLFLYYPQGRFPHANGPTWKLASRVS